MKKITLLLACVSISLSCFAQPSPSVNEATVRAEVKRLVHLIESKIPKKNSQDNEIICGEKIIAERKISSTETVLGYNKHGVAYLSMEDSHNWFWDVGANGWGEKRSRKYYYYDRNWDGMPNHMDAPYCDWEQKYKQEYLLAYFNEIKRVEQVLKKMK